MNRIDQLFASKQKNILSIYYTAGFPGLGDTLDVLTSLQNNGADLVELGMPFSDPLADGPVIQQSSTRALANGMTLEKLFMQLRGCRTTIRIPLLLMGYLNPVLQFGVGRFLDSCVEAGIDGVILPDLPLGEYQEHYADLFRASGIHFIFLITPETREDRIRLLDKATGGFIYMVSSSSTTGKAKDLDELQPYFERIASMQLTHPVLTGFGIRDRGSFLSACRHASGAIIGTAFIRALDQAPDPSKAAAAFLQSILQTELT